LLKSARLSPSLESAPTETIPENAAGQNGWSLLQFPAATTHTTPSCSSRSCIQASKAISGRFFLVGDATVRWKIPAP